MAEYKLKTGQETIRVADGPHAGRKYQPGVIYTDIPPAEAGRFDEVNKPIVSRKSKPADKEAIE